MKSLKCQHHVFVMSVCSVGSDLWFTELQHVWTNQRMAQKTKKNKTCLHKMNGVSMRYKRSRHVVSGFYIKVILWLFFLIGFSTSVSVEKLVSRASVWPSGLRLSSDRHQCCVTPPPPPHQNSQDHPAKKVEPGSARHNTASSRNTVLTKQANVHPW